MDITLSVSSLVISLAAFAGTIVIYNITRRRENYQNLLQRVSLYFTPEMNVAIHRLWDLYRDNGDSEFVDKYIEIMAIESKKEKLIPFTERMEYQLTTLHNQRRIVSAFWRGLGILLRNNLLPKETTFELWSCSDVDIVSKILIPIENRLCDHYNQPRLDMRTDSLYYISKLRNRFYGEGNLSGINRTKQ